MKPAIGLCVLIRRRVLISSYIEKMGCITCKHGHQFPPFPPTPTHLIPHLPPSQIPDSIQAKMDRVDILREKEIQPSYVLTPKDVYEPIFLFSINKIKRPELVRSGAVSTLNSFEYYTHTYCVFHSLKTLRNVRLDGYIGRMARKLLNSEKAQRSNSAVKENYEEAMKLWYRMQLLAAVPLRFMATKIMLQLLNELVLQYAELQHPSAKAGNRVGFIIRTLWIRHIIDSRRYRDQISLVRAEVARHTGFYMIHAPEVFEYNRCARVLDTALADEFNSVSRPALAEVIKIIKHWRKNLKSDFTPEQQAALDMWKPHLEYIMLKCLDMKMRDDADRALRMYMYDDIPLRLFPRKKRRTKAEMLQASLNETPKRG